MLRVGIDFLAMRFGEPMLFRIRLGVRMGDISSDVTPEYGPLDSDSRSASK